MSGSLIRHLLGSLTIAILLTSTTRAVVIQTVPVGSPGNAPDPATGSLYGAVPYNYNIGTFDVTNAQYAAFLNAKASVTDPYGLWNSNMSTPTLDGGVNRTGSGPFIYSVKPGYANKPVDWVSWYEAIRFVNWLQNGQGNGDTESGSYTIINGGNNTGTVFVPDVATRTAWANMNSLHWVLPSENEWYKAAYYNTQSGAYFFYPFQSSSQPAAMSPPGNANSGNFGDNSSGAWVYPAYNYDGTGSHLTDVGAYPSSLSPSGALDMGGDVSQWNDTVYNYPFAAGPYVAVRGGYWGSNAHDSGAGFDDFADPANWGAGVGFRVASIGGVPEPTTLVLFGIGALGLLGVRQINRRRRASATAGRIAESR
jgi:formylglycine-generating enzyme required for sulfatase activity